MLLILIIVSCAIALSGLLLLYEKQIVSFFDFMRKFWNLLNKRAQAIVLIILIFLASLGWWIILFVPTSPDSLDATDIYDCNIHQYGYPRDSTGTLLKIGPDYGPIYRAAIKFDITSLSTDATVSQVKLKIYVLSSKSGAALDVKSYGSNGQDNPETDGDSTCYGRMMSGTVYKNADTCLQSTGSKEITLGGTVNSDVESARDAGTIFSLGLTEDGENTGNPAAQIASDNHGTSGYRPVLEITYSTLTPPTYSNIDVNRVSAGSESIFSCNWQDDTQLDTCFFNWNSSGNWMAENETVWSNAGVATKWANVTKTLNSTGDVVIAYQYWCNDSANAWNTTGAQYLTTVKLWLLYLRDDDPTHGQCTGPGDYDTGTALESPPTTDENRYCGGWVGFFVDEDGSSNETIYNITFHVWMEVRSVGWNKMNIGYQLAGECNSLKDKQFIFDVSTAEHSIYWESDDYTYHLCSPYNGSSGIFQTDDESITNIYNYILKFETWAPGKEPIVVSYVNLKSFVIFNLPPNATLQKMDSDDDELTDFQEVWSYETNPWDNDTDADDFLDKTEIDAGTDPLNSSDNPGFDLNLRVKDWDLSDVVPDTKVYKDSDTKTSDSQGWANWTSVCGTVSIKAKYFGFWVNGSFDVTMDSDKTIDMQCKIHDGDAWIRDYENSTNIEDATVKFYNTTWDLIDSGDTLSTGKYSFTNLPNASLGMEVWRNNTLMYNATSGVITEDCTIQKQVNISYFIANQWNDRTLYSTDIDKTFNQINESLWTFGVNFEIFVVEYPNGTQVGFWRGHPWNLDVQAEAGCSIWVYPSTTALWVHKYD